MTSTLTDRRFGVAEGLAVKVPCRVATTAAITLAGLQTIDNVTLAGGDRVLVWNQANAADNGIYSASSGNWQRCVDFDGNRDVVSGTTVLVTAGDTYALSEFSITASNPIVVGSTSITFTELRSSFGPSTATDDAIALFDGVSGKRIKDSGVTISTDGTLASDSDAKVPTEKAVKTAIDTLDGSLAAVAKSGLKSPMDYSATGDGTADDSAEYAAAEAALDTIYLPQDKVFFLDEEIPTKGKPVFGYGALKFHNAVDDVDAEVGRFGVEIDPVAENIVLQPDSYTKKVLSSDTTTPGTVDAERTSYFNTFVSVGMKRIEDGAQIHRSSTLGHFIGQNISEWERVEAIGDAVMRFAKYGDRITAVGSLALQWLGDDPADLQDHFHDFYIYESSPGVVKIPGEVGWDFGGLETNNPGIGTTIAAVAAATSKEECISNAAFGRDSLLHLIKGEENAAFGYQSIAHAYSAENNAAFGVRALRDGVFITNTAALGRSSGFQKQSGSGDVFIGALAGAGRITGNRGVFVGWNTAPDWTGVDDVVIIGAQAGDGITPYSGAFILGAGLIDDIPLIAGNFNTKCLAFGGEVVTAQHVTLLGDATGALNTYGIRNQQTVQSDSTSTYQGFSSSLSTAAASFTITNLRHFYAQGLTIGAGSTVANQYGFIAQSNLIGATNNYGFYGNIPAGSGRWNFYAGGTAANFFQGDVGIGSFLEMTEISAPSAPAANGARLYTRDNGSGKTQIVAVFNTGAVQVIATQP